MTKTTIYFLRHGEVENPGQILYGRLAGFRLSENGRKRIQEVAQEFKGVKIDYLFTSPLLRARETGRLINEKLHLKSKVSSLLLETKLLPEGVSLEIFRKDIQPHMYEEKFVKKGQESIQTQGERMLRFVKLMQKLYESKTILTISHGDPIMILKAKLLKVPFTWDFKRANYLQPGHFLTLICQNNNYRWE